MLQPLLCCLLSIFTIAHALPQVKLGQTVLLGRDVSDTTEFFGGERPVATHLTCHFNTSDQAFHMLNPHLDNSDFVFLCSKHA